MFPDGGQQQDLSDQAQTVSPPVALRAPPRTGTAIPTAQLRGGAIPEATILQGEAYATLRELPTASVDAVITDPPYSSGGRTTSERLRPVHEKYVNSDSVRGNKLDEFVGDNRDQRSYLAWCTLWLSEALRVTRPGGVALVFSDWRQLPTTTDAIQAGGWLWRGILPWIKPSARPQPGRFRQAAEFITWASAGAHHGARRPALPGHHIEAAPSSNRRIHITQKPVELMRQLTKIVPAGGRILDPFAGSGATGVAAVLEGYDFLGIELTDYAASADERIQEAIAKRRADA